MAINSKNKGDDLEEAVELIERTILSTNQSLIKEDFKITRNKIIMNKGVKYEIDIFVEIDLKIGQKFIYVFECKNWNARPVDPKEISFFADKIDVVGANKGFFVSNKFSKFAKEKAKEFSRLEILKATNKFDKLLIFPELLNEYINITKRHVRFFQKLRRGFRSHVKNTAKLNSSAIYKGENKIAKEVIESFWDNTLEEKKKEIKTNDLENGVYKFKHSKIFNFSAGEFLVNKTEVESIKTLIEFELIKSQSKIITTWDVEKKGRIITYEDNIQHLGKNIRVAMVTPNQP